jgi:hypothetical protein
LPTDFLTTGNRGRHLGTGHYGNAQELHIVTSNPIEYGLGWVLIKIAVDDLVFLTPFEDRSESHHRQGEATIARPGRPWIEQNNHGVFTCAM